MKSARPHLRTFAKSVLLVLAIGGQVAASGAVLARGAGHQGQSYGGYQGNTEERSAPFWSGHLPAEEPRDRTRFIFEDAGV